MAAFYIDNCLSAKIARELGHLHHQAVATKTRGLGRAGDDEQLLVAVQHGETFVTSNGRDFRLLHDAWSRWAQAGAGFALPPHYGILVIPQAWGPVLAAHELASFAARRSLRNLLFYYHPAQGWQQRHP